MNSTLQKILVGSLIATGSLWAQKTQTLELNPQNWTLSEVSLKKTKFKGFDTFEITQPTPIDNQKTLAILKDFSFHNGTIELEVSGEVADAQNINARGFVGLAFRVADTSKFELFYIRPTNGRALDQVRRNHSTQYISYPGFPWEKLRKETPEKYEAYADVVPSEWTPLKIEVKNDTAKLYVKNAPQPTLIVNDLKQGKDLRGSIGLWIGIGTKAYFRNIRISSLD